MNARSHISRTIFLHRNTATWQRKEKPSCLKKRRRRDFPGLPLTSPTSRMQIKEVQLYIVVSDLAVFETTAIMSEIWQSLVPPLLRLLWPQWLVALTKIQVARALVPYYPGSKSWKHIWLSKISNKNWSRHIGLESVWNSQYMAIWIWRQKQDINHGKLNLKLIHHPFKSKLNLELAECQELS